MRRWTTVFFLPPLLTLTTYENSWARDWTRAAAVISATNTAINACLFWVGWFFFFFFFFFLVFFLGPQVWHMEVPRLGVKLELQLLAYTRAHSNAGSLTLWARPGMEPLSSWILVKFVNRWATARTPNVWSFNPLCCTGDWTHASTAAWATAVEVFLFFCFLNRFIWKFLG